uniref:Uncharacterized protein n=1 Tax=Globodera rostochiensis TaxID=31243 RepID=A0A914IDZ4_GLORO
MYRNSSVTERSFIPTASVWTPPTSFVLVVRLPCRIDKALNEKSPNRKSTSTAYLSHHSTSFKSTRSIQKMRIEHRVTITVVRAGKIVGTLCQG